ncbi:helix-turn-helix transcriptional regulator [Nocardioides sp. Bht2]|uniref:helix-turn-helix transcriptional regulator n=1 Tax=Nocardioides sp. Bht2 TaxID=3392297 RepID=UPI0039B5F8B1
METVAAAGSQQTLVGRDRELDELSSMLAITSPGSAARRDFHITLLAGDAGVGKTRLLTELRDRAFAQGWQVAAGHCLDFGDSALPYLPFSEILGRLASSSPEVVERIGALHPGLARLQPGRRVLSDDADERTAVDRAELFEALHALFAAAAAERPLLVVIEDAHWADSSTLDLISFFCSRPFDEPVAMVVSYRGEDLHRRHPLRAKVAAWTRIAGVGRMQLNPLDDAAVRQMALELHPEPITELDLAGIVDRAEGNAFFVEELVGAAKAGAGAGVPDDLADLLLVRLDRLDDQARQVVRVMSAAGRRVSHELLAAASGLDDVALEQGLRAAVESHVVVAAGRHGYAFRHALLAEAVYDDLLPGERVRLHAAYAEALSSGAAPGTAAELARHARAALDLGTALKASIRAGDEAMAVGGPDEAAHHFEHALEIAADPNHRGDVDVSGLVLKTADALVDSGNATRAQQLLDRHIKQLDGDVDPVVAAQLHLQLAYSALLNDNDTDWQAHLRTGQALIPNDGSRERAKLLALTARILSFRMPTEAREVATEALALAETNNLPKTVSDATTTLVGLDREVPMDQLAAALEASASRAFASGALGAELRALFLLGRGYQDRGLFEEAEETFGRASQRAGVHGIPWAPYAFDARLQHAQVAYLAGRWDRVLELTDMGGQAPPLVPEALLVSWQAAVLSARGVPQRARLKGLHWLWQQEGMIAIAAAPVEITEAGLAGKPDEALALERKVLEVLAPNWGELFQARVRLCAVTIGAVAHTMGEQSAEQRERLVAEADRLSEVGAKVVQHQREAGGFWGPEGQAWAKRVRAETLRVHWLAGISAPDLPALVSAWEDSIDAFAILRHPYETATSQLRAAEVLRAAGESAVARELAQQARTTAEKLGATVLLDQLRAFGGQSQRPSASRNVLKRGVEPLTPREREILDLVAQGRSNGEIGKQLFISTKTVSVHVSNILAKLGAAGRTEAAAIARREGLLR